MRLVICAAVEDERGITIPLRFEPEVPTEETVIMMLKKFGRVEWEKENNILNFKLDLPAAAPEMPGKASDKTDKAPDKPRPETEQKNRKRVSLSIGEIEFALKAHGYNIEKAAETLKVSKSGLYHKIKEAGIEIPEQFRRRGRRKKSLAKI